MEWCEQRWLRDWTVGVPELSGWQEWPPGGPQRWPQCGAAVCGDAMYRVKQIRDSGGGGAAQQTVGWPTAARSAARTGGFPEARRIPARRPRPDDLDRAISTGRASKRVRGGGRRPRGRGVQAPLVEPELARGVRRGRGPGRFGGAPVVRRGRRAAARPGARTWSGGPRGGVLRFVLGAGRPDAGAGGRLPVGGARGAPWRPRDQPRRGRGQLVMV